MTASRLPLPQLVVRGRVLGDDATLRGVGVEANETVQVAVSSKRPHTHPLTLLAPSSPPLPTPDVITVIVSEGKLSPRKACTENSANERHTNARLKLNLVRPNLLIHDLTNPSVTLFTYGKFSAHQSSYNLDLLFTYNLQTYFSQLRLTFHM